MPIRVLSESDRSKLEALLSVVQLVKRMKPRLVFGLKYIKVVVRIFMHLESIWRRNYIVSSFGGTQNHGMAKLRGKEKIAGLLNVSLIPCGTFC